MTVGQQKQKWTIEEETALRNGVMRYGAGKWRAIQKDEEFGPILTQRSNVDLKDKWRNISSTNGARARTKGSGQKSRRKNADGSDKEDASPEPDGDKKMLGNSKYDNLILTAIAALKEPDGSSLSDIAEYIEERQPVPPTFKKLVVSKVKNMVLEGRISKVHQNYKINGEFPSDGRPKLRGHEDNKPLFPREITKKLRTDSLAKKIKLDPEAAERRKTSEDAARRAAQAIAEAEAAAAAAEQAAREAEAAELQAELAQAAADAAMSASRPPKKPIKALNMGREVVAVTV